MSGAGYAHARSARRAERRARALARASTRIDPSRVADPLLHPRASRGVAPAALWTAGSTGLHAAVALLGALTPVNHEADPRAYQQSVELMEPPPPPPTTNEPPPETKPPDKPIEPAKPVIERPVKDVPPPEAKAEPPPDPVSEPPPSEPAPTKPARRIVGIDMGSTVVGGNGPAFAVGNTRMGETAKVAEDPNAVGRAGAQFTPPRRTHEEPPEYPASLKAQNVEGEVGLRVEIDAHGKVTGVSVARPSPQDEFNRAAVASAWKGTYEPAVSNGAAVANAIQFTVRFRLRR
jgi:TonB family protein